MAELEKPCALTTYYTDKFGYGRKRYQGRTRGHHQVVFFEAYGWWPEVVRHACDNPPCVEPTHLLGGTHADNAQDRVERGRSTKGEQINTAVLTAQQVISIRERHEQGESARALAREFGVSHFATHQIVHGRTWKHLLEESVPNAPQSP